MECPKCHSWGKIEEPADLTTEVVCKNCGLRLLWCNHCAAFREHDESFGCITCYEFNTDRDIWGEAPWWKIDKGGY